MGMKRYYQWADRSLVIGDGKTTIMGILNVTPDSFSDGGKYAARDAAIRHALAMEKDGAHIIDLGAESTRPYPGSQEVSAEEELERLLPVLDKLLQEVALPVSIDTYKAQVAREALQRGAHIINDVWGLQREAAMADCIAEFGVPVIMMHNRLEADYSGDIVDELLAFFRRSIDIAASAGITADKMILDPGIGFAKTTAHNLAIMSRLEELLVLECPVLLGTSRKRFIGDVLGLPVEDRVEGTAATVALGIAKQAAQVVRVHDVRSVARVAKMMDAMIKGE